jgi:hypothetical protein
VPTAREILAPPVGLELALSASGGPEDDAWEGRYVVLHCHQIWAGDHKHAEIETSFIIVR